MSRLNLKLVIAMSRSHNALFSKIQKNIESFGLNPSEFGVLELLYHKGDQPVQKVAEKILVTSGTITYVIKKLEKKGLVERKRCEEDKRIYYVTLKSKGQQLMEEIFPKHEAFLDKLFSTIKQEDRELLINLLFKLKNNLDKEELK
jgi:MarR family 2-MHQ and catechol resistance regulon transcriptional repressor